MMRVLKVLKVPKVRGRWFPRSVLLPLLLLAHLERETPHLAHGLVIPGDLPIPSPSATTVLTNSTLAPTLSTMSTDREPQTTPLDSTILTTSTAAQAPTTHITSTVHAKSTSPLATTTPVTSIPVMTAPPSTSTLKSVNAPRTTSPPASTTPIPTSTSPLAVSTILITVTTRIATATTPSTTSTTPMTTSTTPITTSSTPTTTSSTPLTTSTTLITTSTTPVMTSAKTTQVRVPSPTAPSSPASDDSVLRLTEASTVPQQRQQQRQQLAATDGEDISPSISELTGAAGVSARPVTSAVQRAATPSTPRHPATAINASMARTSDVEAIPTARPSSSVASVASTGRQKGSRVGFKMDVKEKDTEEVVDLDVGVDLGVDMIDLMNATNMTNCTNDYCVPDEDYLNMIEAYVFPTTLEWVFIAMHAVVFVSGLMGNALVCVAVYRNHTMRTVTNYFIVNLAVADFLVILLCLPPTVMWDVTETWFMGTALCKIVLYFQTVSVTVSVLTLTFISIDRWYAICYPLKFKSTTSRAKKAIVLIWVLALMFDMPELVVLKTKRKPLPIDVIYFTQCLPSWGTISDTTFHCVKSLLLFFLPLAFMTVAYVQIVKVLWSKSNIPGHAETKGCYEYCSANGTSGTNGSTHGSARRTMNRSISSSSQILGRRKAAKMLVLVDIVFAFCYLPVHIYSILRYTMDIPQTEFSTAFAMGSHWLCYFNSAINPVIYNFMSGKFREEFRRAFQQCWCVGCVGGDSVRPAGPAGPAGPADGDKAVRGAPHRPQRVTINLHSLHSLQSFQSLQSLQSLHTKPPSALATPTEATPTLAKSTLAPSTVAVTVVDSRT